MTLTRRRRCLYLALTMAVVMTAFPPAAHSAQFPPQLPSAQEMDRLRAQMGSSLAEVKAAQRKFDALVAGFEQARTDLENANGEVEAVQAQQAALDAQMSEVQTALNERAAEAYRTGPASVLNVIFGTQSFRHFASMMSLFESVVIQDSQVLDTVQELKEETTRLQAELDAKRAEQQQVVDRLNQQQAELESSLAALGREYETIRRRVDNAESGFAFPVRAPFSFVDTFGAPRSGHRKHQGIDIFAAKGTPLYAVVDGVIEDKGVNGLGGNKLWLRSPGDGWTYYYAHMSGYASGISNGARVSKGQVIGYVGNTGNARTTPPHVHFESHPPSSSAANPYPILKRSNPT